MINKIMMWVLAIVMVFSLTACTLKEDTIKYRMKVVTTIFPYYDIVKHLTAHTGGVNVELAVSPGLDSHTFEPTPKDLEKIESATLFIYNGGTMEAWVDSVSEAINRSDKINLCMMDSLDREDILEVDEREELFGMIEEEEGTQEELDEHLWTSPRLMMKMTELIRDKLCYVDVTHRDIYWENAKAYTDRLRQLDQAFRDVTERALKKQMIFADKFPLLYLAREYGLSYYAAFPGCSNAMEPSAKTVAFLEDKVRENRIGAIFYLEFNSGKVAKTIQEDTGARAIRFYSCRNVTKKQFEQNVTYDSLMRENVHNLKIALR